MRHLGSKLRGLRGLLKNNKFVIFFLAVSWGILRPSWLQVEGSWGHLGSKLGQVGAKWAPKWSQVGFKMQTKKVSKAI